MGISRQQALDCLRSDDLIGIGMEADAVRRRLHPEGVVSYAMESAIALNGRSEAEICNRIASAQQMGATAIVLTGAAPSGLQSFGQLIAAIRSRFPHLWLKAFDARQITTLASESGQPVRDVMASLKDAGLNEIGGTTAADPDAAWADVQRAAHSLGIATTARMIFGVGETFETRVEALEQIRRLQQETGGFAAFAPISFHAEGGRELDETTAVEYLKMLAVARMYLDTIDSFESDWTTQGTKVLQMGLRFGANDAGAVQVESTRGATEEEIRRIIRDAGFRPAQRELGYRAISAG